MQVSTQKNQIPFIFFLGLLFYHFHPSIAHSIHLNKEEMQKRLKKFEYPKNHQLTRFRVIRPLLSGLKYEGKLQTAESNQLPALDIPFEYYQSFNPYPHPLLILFGTSAGNIPLRGLLGRYLTGRGVSLLVALRDPDLTNIHNHIEDIDLILARSTVKILHLLDWVQTRPEIDQHKIGLIGVSLGGIHSSLIMGVDPRPQAALLIAAGGNLPEILTKGYDFNTVNFRRQLARREGIRDKKVLLEKLKEHIKLDPLYFASRRNPDDFYFLMADNDLFVPTKNQRELWKALGYPQGKVLPFGHILSILSSPLLFKEYYNFFVEKWQE